MSRTRFSLTLLSAALIGLAPVFAGPLLKGKKTDPARVPALIETLKSDPDEKKRKAAADELGRADVKAMPEIVPALVAALQKDASAAVRTEVAEAIGTLGSVYPVAGVALETAASGDSSPLVRLAAKKSLWEYHLNGYRSPKGADGLTAQTVEPPIASPAAPQPASAKIPVPPIAPAVPLVPQLPAAAPTNVAPLPPVAPSSGPRLPRLGSPFAELIAHLRPAPAPAKPGSIAPPVANVTGEPPIAKRPLVTIPRIPETPSPPTVLVPPPTLPIELPPPAAPPKPDYIPTLPPFKPDLPSVVTPPDATPAPVPVPTIPTIPPTLPPLP